jgi:hypothetical protein
MPEYLNFTGAASTRTLFYCFSVTEMVDLKGLRFRGDYFYSWEWGGDALGHVHQWVWPGNA